MAQVAQLPTQLHPETARLASLKRWNDDPRLEPLFAALRDLDTIGKRLSLLAGEHPALGAQDAASDVGKLRSTYRESSRIHVYEWHTVPNSGAVKALWELLEERRRAWIEAKLTAKGLRMDLRETAQAWHEGYERMNLSAPTVDEARIEANRAASPVEAVA
jgi:hypothetical protein